jgi:hypothetical protein
LVKATPVHANANRLIETHGRFDHLTELQIALVALAHVAGVDAVFGQRLGTRWVVGQQAVAVVMEVADQGHIDAHFVELVANVRHSLGGFGGVDGDAHHLGASDGQLFDLDGGADHVDRVGVGHGLHAHRCAAAHGDNA